jgi:hypothetical protein
MPTAPYHCADGERVPGTTTVIGRFKDSGALMHWAFQQGKAGAERLYDAAEKAADIGTLAHAMVECSINGEDPEKAFEGAIIADEADKDKARNAFKEYLEWAAQTDVKIIAQEMHLVSEEYRFGGTPDAIGMIGNSLCLLDWKTSNAVYPDYAIQLAAYRQLWNENNPDNPLTGASYLLRFSKNYPDFEARKFGDLSEAWEIFKHYRAAYDLDKQLKQRVK